MDQDDSSLLLVLGGVSSSMSTSKSTSFSEANVYDDNPVSPRRGDCLHQLEDYFELQRSCHLSTISALSTPGSSLKDLLTLEDLAESEISPRKSIQSALFAKILPLEVDFISDEEESQHSAPRAIRRVPKRSGDAMLEIHPRQSIQNALFAKRLPLEDDFISDEEDSKAPPPKVIRRIPESSSDAKLDPVAHNHSKSTDVVPQTYTKGPSETEQVRARLETSPPAMRLSPSKRDKLSPVKRNGANKTNQSPEDGKGAPKPMPVRRQLVPAIPPRDFTRPHLGKSYGRSLSLSDLTTTTPSSFNTMMSPQRRRRGKKPGTKLFPMSPSTTLTPRSPTIRHDRHRDPKQDKDGRFRSTSCDQSLDRPHPPSLSLLLPPPSPPSKKSSSISHSSSTEVESESSEESTSKDNDRGVLDDDTEDTNDNNEKVVDRMGATKPMSVRRHLLAANLPRDSARPQVETSYGRSLSLGDLTTAPSSDTMTSPQRRRGKKPGTKLLQMSPLTTSIPRSPKIRCDYRRDPTQHTDARSRSRSTSCDHSSDRPRLRSPSTSKAIRVRSLSRSNPHEPEATGGSGKEDENMALARSRSRQSNSSHSSSTRNLNGTDAPPSGHQPPPLRAILVSSRRGSTEQGSGRLDSPSSSSQHHRCLTSPSSIRRRGKKPVTKLILLSISTTPNPRSPPPLCRDRDPHRDPKKTKDKDARYRSTSCDQPLDRPRLRSPSTSKALRVRSSSSRCNPQENEVMGSSGQEDEKAALARSRSRPSSSSHSSSKRHLSETDATSSGHQPPPLRGILVRRSTEQGSGRLDSPPSYPHRHYLKSSPLPQSSPTTTMRPKSAHLQRFQTAEVVTPHHRSQSMRSLYIEPNERQPRADPLLKTPFRVERKPLPAALMQL